MIDNEIAGETRLVLVQFKSEWNGACQISSMIYEELAKSYIGVVDFFTVEEEEESQLKAEYGINEIPAILFFRGGKLIDHVIGLVPKNVLISKIANALSENISH